MREAYDHGNTQSTSKREGFSHYKLIRLLAGIPCYRHVVTFWPLVVVPIIDLVIQNLLV